MSSSVKQYNVQPVSVISVTSLSANITSRVTEIFNKDNINYQLAWTGNLVGSFDFQVSTNYSETTQVGSWDSLPLSPQPAAAGSAGTWTVDLNNLSSKYIRIVFTYSSGTGNITATFSAKAV